jgi:hypothetical protein
VNVALAIFFALPPSMMDVGFAIICSLARSPGIVGLLYPILVNRPLLVPSFLKIPPHGDALALRSLPLRQVVKRTSTSKLSNMNGVKKGREHFCVPPKQHQLLNL